MKQYILLLMFMGLLCSCNQNDDATQSETKLIGNWNLIQMTGSIPDSETTGAEMDWQEIYQLRADGTFLKSRDRAGVIIEITGTYNLIDNSILEFTFDGASELIGSCTSHTKETMTLQSDTIFLSTWSACDGPGLTYKKLD
ncbi:conserved hypothetical protein containing lipoca lin-like domain [Formosa agariphila KMM 3901]|uniref:Lipocalin-like domain-containing protein n=1 Tax=Formosa agariphila (strain DSM 15362 / KCTC 12365 / LMG 23005 / KMM 3901 / M-2Alg 35-1) TaxID=1347342 RepID=T2KKS2_FORAG|nr:hypothetical protein [Formosa agariphila]CDF79335.1 conserved hypothetical protein containing lipoca lin-like domain [Formosa agariphila KMM 3901]